MGERNRFHMRLYQPDRVNYHVLGHHFGVRCNEGWQGEGDLTTSFLLGKNDIPMDSFLSSDGFGWSVDVMLGTGSGATKLWSGPIVNQVARFSSGKVLFDVECETFAHHIARRRITLVEDHTSYGVANVDASVPVAYLSNDCFSGTPKSLGVSSGAVYPYSDRSAFGPWTAAMGTIATSQNVYFGVQGDGNLFDVWSEIAKYADLYIQCVEDPAAAFTYNFLYPYARTDRTTEFILSDTDGFLTAEDGVTRAIDFRALANVCLMRGEGQDDVQVISWVNHASSVTRYGIFEDTIAQPAVTTENTLADTGARLMDWSTAYPLLTWSLRLVPTDEKVFGLDYFRGDVVRFYHSGFANFAGAGSSRMPGLPVAGDPADGIIVGWSMQNQGEQAMFDIVIGNPPRNTLAEVLAKTGTPGGRGGGGVYTTRGGTPVVPGS